MQKITVDLPAVGDPIPQIPATPGWGRRISARKIISRIAIIGRYLTSGENLMLGLLAFLLGRVVIMSEIAPFGLAFFVTVDRFFPARSLMVAVWAAIGLASTSYSGELRVYILVIALYYYWSRFLGRRGRKPLAAPLLLFLVVMGGEAGGLLFQQFTIYSLLVAFFNGAICMVLAYIFIYGLPLLVDNASPKNEFPVDFSRESGACVIVLLAAAIAGLGETALFGYSLRSIAGGILVLMMALGGGAGTGASVGVAVGLVVGLTSGEAQLSVCLYAVAGVLAGLFRSLGKIAVSLGYLLGSIITILIFGQVQSLEKVIWETMVSAAVFAFIPLKLMTSGRLKVRAREQTYFYSKTGLDIAVAKITNIANMFGELAAAFGTLAAGTKTKIREAEVARVFRAVGREVCECCGQRPECWENNYNLTCQALQDSITQAETQKLTTGNMPGVFRENCVRRKELTDRVNKMVEENRRRSFWQNKVADHRQMVTEQIRAASTVMGNLALEISKEPLSDYELAGMLQDKAAERGCILDTVKISGEPGRQNVEIRRQSCHGRRECVNRILPLAAAVLQEKLIIQAECGNDLQHKKCRLMLQVANRYKVETGTASRAKAADGICGDTWAAFKINSGKVVLTLSDGMGSGENAAGESSMAVEFLRKMLNVGFDVDVAVRTVNSLLLLRKPDDSFATVDMAVIDIYSGGTEFLKIGSAPGFIKRVREVRTVKSSSLPAGILQQLEIEPVKTQLVAGDIVVLVSDGIIDANPPSGDQEPWVANFLRCMATSHPQELAEKILRQALAITGGRVADDMTVVVAKLTEEATQGSRQGLPLPRI